MKEVNSLLKNGHFNTIYSSVFAKKPKLDLERKRFITPDNDFIDVDFFIPKTSLGNILFLHGLEGNSSSSYMQRALHFFIQRSYSVFALNQRGCGGEINKLLRSYHSGNTADLDFVLEQLHSRFEVSNMHIVGFSLGGNITLKYGSENHKSQRFIKSLTGISVPVDLAASAQKLNNSENFIYLLRFLKRMKKKMKLKKESFPNADINWEAVLKAKSFADFDNAYTAPVHGYASAEDYWAKASSLLTLESIELPALLINAKDDPFLTPSCYPDASNIKTIYPPHGGHVGFHQQFNDSQIWLFNTLWDFLRQVL